MRLDPGLGLLFCIIKPLTSVSYCLNPASSVSWAGLRVKRGLVVVRLGNSSGGCSFTTHCAAGLSLDAGVVPLAAGEMSCLLPFPYTPKPNEQHGARCPALRLHCNLPPSSDRLLPSWLHRSSMLWSVSSSAIFLFAPSILPSLKPAIYPPLLSWSLRFRGRALAAMWPHHLEAGSQWPGMAFQAKVSAVTLPWRTVYTHTHRSICGPHEGMYMHASEPHMHVYIACASTHPHMQTYEAFMLPIQNCLTYILQQWQWVIVIADLSISCGEM